MGYRRDLDLASERSHFQRLEIDPSFTDLEHKATADYDGIVVLELDEFALLRHALCKPSLAAKASAEANPNGRANG